MAEPQIGGRLTGSLAKVLADTVARTYAYTRPADAQHRQALAGGLLEDAERVHAPMLSDLLGHLGDLDGLPEPIRRFVGRLTGPTHQWEEILLVPALFSLAQQITSALLAPFLRSTEQWVNRKDPNMPLDPSTAAAALVRGWLDDATFRADLAAQGFDDKRATALAELGATLPALGELLTMLRRGHIDEATFADWARQGGVRADTIAAAAGLRLGPIGPAEAVMAVVQSHLDEAAGRAVLEQNGVDPAWWSALYETAGEPPGPETMLDLLRRGIVDRPTVEQAIRESRVKNKYVAPLLDATYGPIGVGQAVAAAVQSHLSADEARTLVEQNGVDGRWFDTLYETAGRPPGPETMLDLWNRGIASEADVVQAIRESDVKNKYVPALLASARRIPPERTVVSMVRKGVLAHDAGAGYLHALGFDDVATAALLAEATTDAHEAERELAKGEIVALYEARIVPHDQAQQMIVDLGYADTAAGMLLALADSRLERQRVSAAVTKVRSLYVGYRADRTETASALDAIGVTASQRGDLLDLWDVERTTGRVDLTEAQARDLLRHGIIDAGEYLSRLLAMGYTDADAALLVARWAPDTTGGG